MEIIQTVFKGAIDLIMLILKWEFPIYEYKISIFNVLIYVVLIYLVVWFIKSHLGGQE